MSDVFDSYTGDPYVEDYQSQIEGIEQGRSPFWKERERKNVSEQYWIAPDEPEPDPAVPPSPEGPSQWLVRRRGCPATLFPVLPALTQAVAVMDWLVENDGSVGVAIHWMNKQNPMPLFSLLDHIIEVANGA